MPTISNEVLEDAQEVGRTTGFPFVLGDNLRTAQRKLEAVGGEIEADARVPASAKRRVVNALDDTAERIRKLAKRIEDSSVEGPSPFPFGSREE